MASNAVRAAAALKLYNKFPKNDIFREEGAHLPDAYKKFYKEWKLNKPLPVHYIPSSSKWSRNAVTGEVNPVQDQPIPLIFPPESHLGIWGGEGVIKGFQKRNRLKQRVAHFWVPNLIKSVVYSEILDKRMKLTVTERTIDLILQHNGFDNYILQSRACDLQSTLSLKIKQKMLSALYNKDLYAQDPVKMEEVYAKYKHFLNGYSAEDIDWYGLTFDEALRKAEKIEEEKNKPVALKHQLRLQLIQNLMNEKQTAEESRKAVETESWVKRLNPFTRKS